MRGKRTNSLFENGEAEISDCSRIVRVVFDSGADAAFDYLLPDKFWPVEAGQRLQMPFGRKNKLQVGFCICPDVEVKKSFAKVRGKGALKKVTGVVDDEPLLDSRLVELAHWISRYYVCPLGQVLAAMVPGAVKKGIGVKAEKYIYLLKKAGDVLEQIRGMKQKKIVAFLDNQRAYGPENSVKLQNLLSEVGCTREPLKKLTEKQVVKTTDKTVLKSLPVIPECLSDSVKQITLNEEQQKALNYIDVRIKSNRFSVTLLHGVTDSGKTEIYIRAIETVLKQGRGAIVLLPEIALTTQTVQRFSSRFEKLAVMHSGLTASQRNSEWNRIKNGKANVVIGARSAVFAPLGKLGLLVVDEAHESSYKQETVPRYHGRDVAIKRAQLSEAHCILGSATPSLEMLNNCRDKEHFCLVRLPKRVMDLPFPEMRLVDMRKEYLSSEDGVKLLSDSLTENLKQTLERKEQAILLLNRRGYSNFVFCPSCMHTLRCRNCDSALTFHKAKVKGVSGLGQVTGRYMDYGYAVCHYCMSQTLVPEKCPLCGAGLAMIGMGSQRLEEELKGKFPRARIRRVDSDSMAKGDYFRLLSDFSQGRIDVFTGTQILAKGLHFPNVTLVGIVSADTCLYFPDFRANERTFQLISQVAGRAGRSEKKGLVLIQTFLPDQPAIQYALKNDFDGFVREELQHRKACNLPPFWRLAVIELRDMKFDKLEAACQVMREGIDRIISQKSLDIIVKGPMPATISRIQRFHRMQLTVRAPRAGILRELFTYLRAGRAVRPTVQIRIDVDPINLL